MYRGIYIICGYLLAIIGTACTITPATNPVVKKDKVIALLPYQNFDAALTKEIQKTINEFYSYRVIVLPAIPLPKQAYYPARSRYRADSLLQFQNTLLADSILAIVGLTTIDISTTNGTIPDWGVFGLGLCPGRVCVASIYRFNNEADRLSLRLQKVVLHELGHNMGLPHCTQNPQCLLTDARGKLSQVDREEKMLCTNCRKKLVQ
jgi:archaemetzincin